jgi:ABC-type uncharacterized transport system involved in gliding motility auxiliary subunit
MPKEHPITEGREAGAPYLAGTFASAGVGLLLAGTGVAVMRGLAWPAYALWGVGAAALLAAIVMRRREVVAALRGRGVRYGSNTAVLVAAALGIAVLANYLAVRHHQRWDLTRTRAHTLSPQTRKLLRGLEQPLEIIAFYSQERDRGGYQQVRDLLREYERGSRQVQVRVIDPDLSPGPARRYGVTDYETTIIRAGERKEQLSFAGEQEITSAILRLTRSKRQQVYFVQGNGEHDFEGQDPDGCGSAKEALTALGYQIAGLSLMEKDRVPADCDVLVIAGPRQRYGLRELAAINAYLDGGGAALVMVDPEPQGEALEGILRPRGLTPLPGIVVEPTWNLLGDASSVTVSKFEPGDITRPFARGGRTFVAVFVLARAFERDHEQSEFDLRDLVRTSDDSWIESDFRGTIRKSPREPGGPLTIAATVTARPPSAGEKPDSRQPQPRLVVFGDSDFVANDLIANGVNKDLFVNAIGWLARAGEFISIQPKPREQAPILLTPTQTRIVFVLSLIVMPLAAIVVGAVVWWRRR